MQRLTFDEKGVFDLNSAGLEDVGKIIYTLFLNDSSLEIRRSAKNQGVHGGYHFKALQSHVYKVQTNSHGDKYLRVYKKVTSGKVFSMNSYELYNDEFLFAPRYNKVSINMRKVIEDHLSSMLGLPFLFGVRPEKGKADIRGSNINWYECSDAEWLTSPEGLCYPFLRNAENRELASSLLREDYKRLVDSDMAQTLNFQWDGLRGMSAALRNSKTKEEFIRNLVYKSAVRTEADLDHLMKKPSLARVFSNFDMKIGAKAVIEGGYADIFNNAHKYMNTPEIFAFQFLLKNLPKKMTSEVLDFATEVVAFRLKSHTKAFRLKSDNNEFMENASASLAALVWEQERNDYRSYQNAYKKPVDKFLQKVPPSGKQDFALSFWEKFKDGYKQTVKTYDSIEFTNESFDWKKYRDNCFVKVMDVFMKVYVDKVVRPLPENGLDSCNAAAMELFGFDLTKDESLKSETSFLKTMGVTVSYYDFSKHVSKRFVPRNNRNLFNLLGWNADTTHMWANAFHEPAYMMFTHKPSPMNMILASDLEKTLRKAAAKIDAGLLKLGKEITVANRLIYLESSERERKFKVNWRYYDFGVPVDEVPLYKKAGIKSKKDIAFWVDARNTLPADMYKELLEDAGKSASDEDVITSLAF